MSDGTRDHPYTVAMLIEELSKHPANRRIVVPGYEGGFRDADPEMVRLNLNKNSEWFYGPHEEAEKGQMADCEALCL